MNPEIRFRVPDDVYALASDKAERLLGDSARGLSNLARGALYRVLGLPLPPELADLEPPPLQPEHILVSVRHGVLPEYRREQALTAGRAIPHLVTTDLTYPPGKLPPAFLPLVELEHDGRATVRLALEGLQTRKEHATEGEVLQALKVGQRTAKALAGWADEHGSPLVKARREEGFDWERLARLEFARRLLSQAGLTGFRQVEEAELRPYREPSLDAIERLRAARAQAATATLSLVLVSEGRRGDYSALQATVTAPDGVPVSLVRRLENSLQSTRMQTLAP